MPTAKTPRRRRASILRSPDEAAELSIIRQAIVTGIVTPLAESLCRTYYGRFSRERGHLTPCRS